MNSTTPSSDRLTVIDTIEELRYYLQEAMVLEHATIPPYLSALYSIKPGTNVDARNIIRAVVVEEMLHLTLAANVHSAVGGTPSLTYPGFVPNYPAYLPDGETDFTVSLERFSEKAVDLFLQIERPTKVHASRRFLKRSRPRNSLAPAVLNREPDLHFYNIGEFYAEILHGLERLHDQHGNDLFCGDPKRQITPEYYYSGGGDIVPVVDMKSAKAALELIIDQGEGHGGAIDDEESELSHYYRFQQLTLGQYYLQGDSPGQPTGERFTVDWDAVYPIKTNAKLTDYGPEDSELYAAAKAFNTAYFGFLKQLEDAFTGHPELLLPAVGGMFRIREQASALMRNPIPDLEALYAAPTFEVNPAPNSDTAAAI
jgi:hypothetical protein